MLTMGPWSFFSKPNLRDASRKIRKIVIDICGIGASLIGRSQFWQDPPPFFSGAKNENFTMVPMGTFCFVTQILNDPPMKISEIPGIHNTLVVLLHLSYNKNGISGSFTFHKSNLHIICMNLLPNSVLEDPFHHFHSMFQQFNSFVRSTLPWIPFPLVN